MPGELLLMTRTIGPPPSPQEGDIIVAVNELRTFNVRTQHITNPRRAAKAAKTFLGDESLPKRWLEAVSQYRFERISETEVRRTEIRTGTFVVFGPSAIDVSQFVANRKAALDPLFGTDGAEVWYGGRMNITNATLNEVWDYIELETAHRRTDAENSLFPWTPLELRRFLVMPSDDFSDQQTSDLVGPLVQNETNDAYDLVREHRYYVDWDAMPLPVAKPDIRNVSLEVDLRGQFQATIASDVQERSLS